MNKVLVDFRQSKGRINRNIYGHFSEHIGGVFYDGLWVGEDSGVEHVNGFRKKLVDSFKAINPPVLRWPGGCFAETYDWRDGIGPRGERPTRINWWYSHDKRTEPNHVGTHEFIQFCRLVGAEPYIAANMTSVTPLHIRNWVEYCNVPQGLSSLALEREKNGAPQPFDVVYWGIGNENWGGGGQMTPEGCADEFIRYSTVINSLDKGKLKFIMCGANGHDIEWTRRLMQAYASRKWHEAKAYGMSVHYYCGKAGNPTAFTEDEWYQQLLQADFMQQVLDDHRAAMNEFDLSREIGLVVDEWGCWHPDGSGPSRGYNLFEQQSTMRDAVVAAMTLNMFNNRCDSVVMANVAQLCNNLHSLYLAGGPHFVETPNYHVFNMFKGHQDGRHLHVSLAAPVYEKEGYEPLSLLSASASEKAGTVTLSLANLSVTESRTVVLDSIGRPLGGQASVAVLSATDPRAHNTFENPTNVAPTTYTLDLTSQPQVDLPAASVVVLTIADAAP